MQNNKAKWLYVANQLEKKFPALGLPDQYET